MTPMMRMPVLRQIYKTPEGPWWRRILRWWRAPVVYEVVEEFDLYMDNLEGMSINLTLPAGFRSDLASTPRISWLFGFRPDHPALCLAGLYHDWYYRYGFFLSRYGIGDNDYAVPFAEGKKFADKLFCRMLAELAHVRTPSYAAYFALSMFGWIAWRANAKYRAIARELAFPHCNRITLQGDYTDD